MAAAGLFLLSFGGLLGSFLGGFFYFGFLLGHLLLGFVAGFYGPFFDLLAGFGSLFGGKKYAHDCAGGHAGLFSFSVVHAFYDSCALQINLYDSSPQITRYNKCMSNEADKNENKVSWSERGRRVLRGAAVVGTIAVGAVIIF